MFIEVCDMRAANKPGYVARISESREKHFLIAKSYSSHGASAKQVCYEIVDDGIYEICDANFGGRKRKISFIVVKNGECVFEVDNLPDAERHEDYLNGKLEQWVTDGVALPELEGTPKQVAWATDIRSTAIKGGLDTRKAAQIRLAKSWIENRHKLAEYGVK